MTNNTQGLLEEVLDEFRALSRQMTDGALGSEGEYELRLARDEALADLAALRDKSEQIAREAEAERAALRADLARARIECEQLRGQVSARDDEIYQWKLQREQEEQSRRTVDVEQLKNQLLEVRADLLASRADLLAQKDLTAAAEVQCEALKASESRLTAALQDSRAQLVSLQQETSLKVCVRIRVQFCTRFECHCWGGLGDRKGFRIHLCSSMNAAFQQRSHAHSTRCSYQIPSGTIPSGFRTCKPRAKCTSATWKRGTRTWTRCQARWSY